MRLYNFQGKQYCLENLQKRRLKISRINDLNDPFEFIGADLSDREKSTVLIAVKNKLHESKGILCFCSEWTGPLLWAHYADKHQGLCFGFDIPDELAKDVEYVKERLRWPTGVDIDWEDFMGRMICTKFSHWSYENEFRQYFDLSESVNDLFFIEFSENLALREVIIGCRSSISTGEVIECLGDLAQKVEIFRARPSDMHFRMARR
jgi:hypothetical protein